MAAGNVSIQLGLQGKCTNDVTACATGTNNIGDAFRSIQYGEADVMVAGGTEAAVCPCAIAGFGALTALSPSDDPEKCSLPFDKNRSGFVLGEGAGIVVLEELEHAKARGAKIYAEVVGYGCSADAYHITSPLEDGAGAARAMQNAIEDAGVDKTRSRTSMRMVLQRITTIFLRPVPLSYCLGIMQRTLRSILQSP